MQLVKDTLGGIVRHNGIFMTQAWSQCSPSRSRSIATIDSYCQQLVPDAGNARHLTPDLTRDSYNWYCQLLAMPICRRLEQQGHGPLFSAGVQFYPIHVVQDRLTKQTNYLWHPYTLISSHQCGYRHIATAQVSQQRISRGYEIVAMPALHQKSNVARRSRRAHAVPKESLAVSISSRND